MKGNGDVDFRLLGLSSSCVNGSKGSKIERLRVKEVYYV